MRSRDSENHAIVEYYKDLFRGLQGTRYKVQASKALEEMVGMTNEEIVAIVEAHFAAVLR